MDDDSPVEELYPETSQWTVPGLPRACAISVVGMVLTAVAAIALLSGRAAAGPARQLVTLARTTPLQSSAQMAPAFVTKGLLAAAAANGSVLATTATAPAATAPAASRVPAPPAAAGGPPAAVPAAAVASPVSQAAAAAAQHLLPGLRTVGAAVAVPLPLQFLRSGSVDQGVDYTAPGGTPLYAMGPGVIIAEGGIAGFGPNTPVLLITAGALKGRTVYYGHAGPNVVPVGAHVVAGQQIGVVGSGIVGLSTGPHLEIGFYPLTGNMGAGAAMMAYLNALVGHPT